MYMSPEAQRYEAAKDITNVVIPATKYPYRNALDVRRSLAGFLAKLAGGLAPARSCTERDCCGGRATECGGSGLA